MGRKLESKGRGGRSGNVAVVFALFATPMILLVGAGVDFYRAYYVREALQYALDAATLSVASSSNTDATVLKDRFGNVFSVNYTLTDEAPAGTPEMKIDGNQVTSSVSATLDTVFIAAVVPTLTIAVESGASRNTSGVELVLALDTTGSMADNNKMTELKVAAHSLVDSYFGSSTIVTGIKIGIVPFTDTVNIGSSRTTDVSPAPSTYNWGTTTWSGCVMAPASPYDQTDAFSSGGKWKPYYYPADSNNLWAKTKKGKTTYTINSTQGPNLGCVAQAITPLTNQKAPLDAAIDALSPNGSTHINIGLVWAWYVISQGSPFTEGLAYDDPTSKKYIVLMTDGENTYQAFSAYGYLSSGNLGTTNQSSAVNVLNNRLKAICDNIKANGVTIYTVALDISTTTAKNLLEYCATPPGRYFEAVSSDLVSTFNTIGGQISKVRLSK